MLLNNWVVLGVVPQFLNILFSRGIWRVGGWRKPKPSAVWKEDLASTLHRGKGDGTWSLHVSGREKCWCVCLVLQRRGYQSVFKLVPVPPGSTEAQRLIFVLHFFVSMSSYEFRWNLICEMQTHQAQEQEIFSYVKNPLGPKLRKIHSLLMYKPLG